MSSIVNKPGWAGLTRAGAHTARSLVSVMIVAATVLAISSSAAHAQGTETPSGFHIETFTAEYLNRNGTQDTQAGSHPYEIVYNTRIPVVPPNGFPVKELREVVAELPPGLVGDPNAVPQCTRPELDEEFAGKECPLDTQVGTIGFCLGEQICFEGAELFNMKPPKDSPAQIAFQFFGERQFFNTAVRTNSDYGLTVTFPNIVQREPRSFLIHLWGFPGEHTGAPIKPFFTLPTACVGPLKTIGLAHPWQAEGQPIETSEVSFLTEINGVPFGYTGCEHLRFTPAVSVAPQASNAETPAGISTEVREPQEGISDPTGVSQSDIKDAEIVFPEGVAINPGAAAGLGACQFSEDGVGTTGPPTCPSDSKVGTDVVTTPLLKENFEGNVYVLQSNPPNLKLLISAYAAGTWVKLVGNATVNETTGQLTVLFPEIPQFPVSNVTLSTSGGARATLMTPPTCGTFGIGSNFTPWSTPYVKNASATDQFSINSGPGGRPCVSKISELPFTPTMTAGATTDQAGGFTDFSMLLQREDGQQRIASLQFKTPEGLLGMISKIKLCEEPQAASGECSAESQIGHTVVGAGPGPYPLFIPEPGKPPAPIYLTGPYDGAPYGLAIVVPVAVGPFNLGTIVVRATVEVDRYTSRLTITTNPATLPTILKGVPADIRDINAVIDRPEFMFNPTSCAPMSFSGTAYSTEGATAPLTSHFQVGSCKSLAFDPNFQVSTQGKTSRSQGASLTAKVLYPTGALGHNQASSQTNIGAIKVELPKQLPARLTTLQKACPGAVFEANPAGCPAPSVIGHVMALTPVLSVPLTGPAYFVSHGNESFPSLVVVLQGAGVTIDLVGTTFISKAGITSSTFKSIPDVPIGLFELVLPEGPYSALAANGNVCNQTLYMPTEFIGQNGAILRRETKFTVTGCPKAAVKKPTKKKHAKKKHSGKGKH